MYPSVVSVGMKRSWVSLPVASSINTSRVQDAERPSNQSCGLPSIWIISPNRARRSRIGWAHAVLPFLGRQCPALIINWRVLSTDSRTSCSSASFSQASVGPKSL
jgi:hypothetical protein